MEEISSTSLNRTAGSGSSSSPRLTSGKDGFNEDGEMDMLGTEVPSADDFARHKSSSSDDSQDEEARQDEDEDDDGDACENSATQAGHREMPDSTTDSGRYRARAPRRSKRKPAPKVTWWERNPKAYAAAGPEVGAIASWDLNRPPVNEKEARVRPDWPLWKAAEKEEYLAHKKLGTWSKTKETRKRKAVKTRYV